MTRKVTSLAMAVDSDTGAFSGIFGLDGVENTIPGFVVSASAPNNSDGKPNGTIHIQDGVGTFTKVAGIYTQNLSAAAPRWVKVGDALSYTTFQAAATTKSNTLFSLAAGGVIHAVKIKHSTAFAGGAISAVTLAVGITGTANKYATAFDVLQAVGNTAFGLSSTVGSENHAAATAIKITATSTNANLSELTAGVVDVWALVSFAV